MAWIYLIQRSLSKFGNQMVYEKGQSPIFALSSIITQEKISCKIQKIDKHFL